MSIEQIILAHERVQVASSALGAALGDLLRAVEREHGREAAERLRSITRRMVDLEIELQAAAKEFTR